MRLDDKGRCCGRKPFVYKRDGHKFCPRCDRAYDLDDGEQITNWAWRRVNGDFIRVVAAAPSRRSTP